MFSLNLNFHKCCRFQSMIHEMVPLWIFGPFLFILQKFKTKRVERQAKEDGVWYASRSFLLDMSNAKFLKLLWLELCNPVGFHSVG